MHARSRWLLALAAVALEADDEAAIEAVDEPAAEAVDEAAAEAVDEAAAETVASDEASVEAGDVAAAETVAADEASAEAGDEGAADVTALPSALATSPSSMAAAFLVSALSPSTLATSSASQAAAVAASAPAQRQRKSKELRQLAITAADDPQAVLDTLALYLDLRYLVHVAPEKYEMTVAAFNDIYSGTRIHVQITKNFLSGDYPYLWASGFRMGTDTHEVTGTAVSEGAHGHMRLRTHADVSNALAFFVGDPRRPSTVATSFVGQTFDRERHIITGRNRGQTTVAAARRQKVFSQADGLTVTQTGPFSFTTTHSTAGGCRVHKCNVALMECDCGRASAPCADFIAAAQCMTYATPSQPLPVLCCFLLSGVKWRAPRHRAPSSSHSATPQPPAARLSNGYLQSLIEATAVDPPAHIPGQVRPTLSGRDGQVPAVIQHALSRQVARRLHGDGGALRPPAPPSVATEALVRDLPAPPPLAPGLVSGTRAPPPSAPGPLVSRPHAQPRVPKRGRS